MADLENFENSLNEFNASLNGLNASLSGKPVRTNSPRVQSNSTSRAPQKIGSYPATYRGYLAKADACVRARQDACARNSAASARRLARNESEFTRATMKLISIYEKQGARAWAYREAELANRKYPANSAFSNYIRKEGGIPLKPGQKYYDCTGDLACAIRHTDGGAEAAGVVVGAGILAGRAIAKSGGAAGSTAPRSNQSASNRDNTSGSKPSARQVQSRSGGTGRYKIEPYGRSRDGSSPQYKITCNDGTTHRYWRQGGEWHKAWLGAVGLSNWSIQQLAEDRCK